MTKRIAIFALLLMAALGMQAQSLLGTWKTTVDEDGQKKDYYLAFTQDTLTVKVLSPITDVGMATFVISVQQPYNYTLSGDLIAMKGDAETMTMGIEKMEFYGQVAEAIKQNPEMKKMIEDEMKKAVMKGMEAFKDQYMQELSNFNTMIIQKLTATELVLVDKDGPNVFTRVN